MPALAAAARHLPAPLLDAIELEDVHSQLLRDTPIPRRCRTCDTCSRPAHVTVEWSREILTPPEHRWGLHALEHGPTPHTPAYCDTVTVACLDCAGATIAAIWRHLEREPNTSINVDIHQEHAA